MAIHLLLTAIAIAATVAGILEGRADTVRGRGALANSSSKSLVDYFIYVVMLLALILGFFWLWRSWPWYDALILGIGIFLIAETAVMQRTLPVWMSLRPAIAGIVGVAVALMWLGYPPP